MTQPHVQLDGIDVALRPGTRKLLTVRQTRDYFARITLWELEDGTWVERAATDGRIGNGGLADPNQRLERTMATPRGTYRLLYAFGTHRRRRAWRLGYRRIGRGDYWVGDNASPHYNRWRHKREGGFRTRLGEDQPNVSERLADYPKAYEYAMVVDFNYDEQVRKRGFAIFLHVQGEKGTGGCVAVPRPFMKMLLTELGPEDDPLIAIGPSR